MRGSQLVVRDAAIHILGRLGVVADWVICLAFDNGDRPEPTIDEVHAALADRFRQSDVWNRRLHEAPGDVDFPYWIATDDDLRNDISAHPEAGLSWSEVEAAVAEMTLTPVVLTDRPWSVVTFHGVTGVKRATGTCTVVALKVSHGFLVGAHVGEICNSLFGAEFSPIAAAGLNPAAPKYSRPRAVARAMGRVPGGMLRFYALAAWNSRPAFKRMIGQSFFSGTAIAATQFNTNPGAKRVVRNLTIPTVRLRFPGISVTEVGLTAISIAMQKQLEDDGQPVPALRCTLPVHVDWPELGVNKLMGAAVDLHTEATSVRERAQGIHDSLRQQRERASSDNMHKIAKFNARVPYLVLRRATKQSAKKDPISAHSGVSSVKLPKVLNWTLCGGPFVDFVGMPAMGSTVGLVHTFGGFADEVVISVLTSPDTIGDVDRYMTHLENAVEEVIAALGQPSSGDQ